MAIAPWIVPPDYLGAMRAGAGLGLAAAAQDISGEESADRLRLAYSQMAQQERQQQRQLEAAKEYRAAQQLLRQGQMDALARYRQQMEADRTQRANLAERQFQAMDLYRKQQADATDVYRKQLEDDRAARRAETERHNMEAEESKKRELDAKEQATITNLQKERDNPETDAATKLELTKQIHKRLGITAPPETAKSGSFLSDPFGYVRSNLPNIAAVVAPGAVPLAVGLQRSLGGQPAPAAPAAPPTPAPQGKKRVRVTGPNGERGTIEEGDTLPEGWAIVQ